MGGSDISDRLKVWFDRNEIDGNKYSFVFTIHIAPA